jgi:hypothetical protein
MRGGCVKVAFLVCKSIGAAAGDAAMMTAG